MGNGCMGRASVDLSRIRNQRGLANRNPVEQQAKHSHNLSLYRLDGNKR